MQADKTLGQKVDARNISFLIDAALYFQTLEECIRKAQRRIYILAWDIGSQVELLKTENKKNVKLGELLFEQLEKNPQLEVYILCWNFPLAYVSRRATPLSLLSGWKDHERLLIRYDETHPVGGCHHQKIVVIDDSIAFSGGIDICQRRWDTPEHSAEDPRRLDAHSDRYPPFHDIQLMVDGNAAKALGDLFRERWKRNSGENLPTLMEENTFLPNVPIHLRDTEVRISLTYPRFGGYKEERQIEEMTLACLDKAKNLIYIENQFLTAERIHIKLGEILRTKNGPEIVIVLPKKPSSFLESIAILAHQNKMIKRLKRSDHFNRLGIFYPAVPGCLDGVLVHSKLLIVDKTIIKVGSANLNNRSMGLDTECDISVEAKNETQQLAIETVLKQLLCEHLEVSLEELDQSFKKHNGSLLKTIAQYTIQDRSLRYFDDHTPFLLRWMSLSSRALDPSAPLKREQVVSQFLRQHKQAKPQIMFLGIFLVCSTLIALAMAWYSYSIEELRAPISFSYTDFEIGLIFLSFGLLIFIAPVWTLILLLTLFGPIRGFFVGWVSLIGVSLIQYFLGSFVSQEKIKTLANLGTQTLGQQLTRMRALPAFILRLLPVAPLPVMNLISGSVGMPLTGFLALSVFSPLPLLLTLSALQILLEEVSQIFGHQVSAMLLIASTATFLILILIHPKGKNILKRGYR